MLTSTEEQLVVPESWKVGSRGSRQQFCAGCVGKLCSRSWEEEGWNRCRSSRKHWSCSRDHRDPAARKPFGRQGVLEQLLIIASNAFLVGTAGTSTM